MVPTAPRPPWATVALAVMADRGLSAAHVAGAMGLSRRAWVDRTAGRVRPLTSEISRLAVILDCPVELLIGADTRTGGRSGPDLELLTERDKKVYAAAHRVDPGPDLGSVIGVQDYVDAVLLGSFWSRWSPEVNEVQVRGPVGAAEHIPAWHEAALEGGRVTHVLHIPPWARRPLTVLHELAHVAVHPILWAKPHGPQFARLWVELVTERMGATSARRLRAELSAEGVGLATPAAVAAQRLRGLTELARLLGSGGGER